MGGLAEEGVRMIMIALAKESGYRIFQFFHNMIEVQDYLSELQYTCHKLRNTYVTLTHCPTL